MLSQIEFANRLREVLSPSQAIVNPHHLKGRSAALKEAQQAFSAHGRQVFIHGLRGVGKSSVALTTANIMSESGGVEPVLIFCSQRSNFAETIRDLCARALNLDPFQTASSVSTEAGLDAKVFGVGAGAKRLETKAYNGVPLPGSVNEAVELVRRVSPSSGPARMFVVDEFDLLQDEDSHQQFGEFVKLIADSRVNARFIFCGVAQDLDQIFKAHGSTFRIFHPMKLDALKIQACLDIISDAEKAIGVEIDRNSKIRITQICDGFPYFVHLITEKLLWRWFDDPNRDEKATHPRHYESALYDACAAAEPELRLSYDSVVKKQKTDGEIILWSIAEGNKLDKSLDTIVKDFDVMFDQLPDRLRPTKQLTRSQLNSRLANMKRDEYKNILMSKWRGWYEFREKRMRGYARLRAASVGIYLRADHPLGE